MSSYGYRQRPYSMPSENSAPPSFYHPIEVYPTMYPTVTGWNVVSPLPLPPPPMAKAPKRPSAIGGNSPVEVYCDKCHSHVITDVHCKSEERHWLCGCIQVASFCLFILSFFSFIALVFLLHSINQLGEAFGLIFFPMLIMFFAALCFGKSFAKQYYVHYCPKCGALLATVKGELLSQATLQAKTQKI